MKFFKLLLQILAMGLCFVAGMTYEKNLLLKATPDGEIGTNSGSIKNDDIIIDNTAPTEQQEVIDEGFNFDGDNNNNDVVDDGTIPNGNNTTQPQDNGSQQTEEPTIHDQTIIINDIEVINDNVEDDGTTTQPEQNIQMEQATQPITQPEQPEQLPNNGIK